MTNRKEPPFFNDDSVGAFQYKLPFYDTMELFIETLTGTCFELRVLPFEAVVSVKAKIQRLEGIPVAQQHLIWNNVELDDDHCLHDYGIAEGCTLKLVLAMRGGPINTRRVTLEDPIKEVADLMESTKEDGWDKNQTNKQVTFVVYREGDQLSFFRVVDRGDGTLTPLSESLSGGSVYNVYAEEDGESSAAAQHCLENSITMTKMKLLKAKMEDMNLNKKKSVKVTPLALAEPHPGPSSLGPPSTQHLHRLFRSLPQINQPWQTNAPLPPIADPSPPPAAATSAHVTVHRRSPPSFSSSSCYMLQEEEPWEACPPFAKIRPPPKVSRMDIGSRLMKDCVYPQLPPLCSRGASESPFDPVEPSVEAVGLSILEEPVGLVVPAQPGASFGELSDPLSLDMSIQHEGGHQTIDVGAQHQLPHSTSTLCPWTLGTSDGLTSRADGTQLGTSVHISPPSPLPASPSPSATRLLSQPFDSTLCIQSNLQAQSSSKSGSTSPHPPASLAAHPARLRGVKVESPGKRPELISKREARGITKMVNQACKEPLGSLNNAELFASLSTRAPDSSSRDSLAESLGFALTLPPAATASGQSGLGSRLPSIPTNKFLQEDLFRPMSPLRRAAASYRTSNCLASAGGVMSSFGTLGTPTYHLPPVKAPTGSKKKSSKHCFLCGKKTGLATSYECRCGNNFCATHRYAETHDCSYDYKTAGRRFLQETNPLISAPKLPKI
ncbi:PREDICTED: AN1-type zinc finger protein 4 [Poecilia mexicana]|uniref:Zinc finger, AN1-type domain 4 n=1 Tax=Poecilia mexicana TaxID=48701 RepID=A0A3B3Y898_9TELE|nr:PREDICTED: AN1-type zinc finger protein 4 [Poecilia mexicana]